MNQLQLDDVKKALDLSSKIEDLEEKRDRCLEQSFRKAPTEPTRQEIKTIYPEIKLSIKKDYTAIDWLITFAPAIFFFFVYLLVGLMTIKFAILYCIASVVTPPVWVWGAIYRFCIWGKKKKKAIEKSTKYKKQCEEIDREVAERQAEADAKYEAEMQEYKEVIMPQYQQEKAAWNARKKETLDKIRKALDYFNNELSQHYQTTKIVPLNYRNTHALSEIYTIMANSAYDVDRAIDIYDRNEQRKLDEARLREQQRANRLADEQNRLAYEQNQLLDEQNSIAEEARRDANRAATVAAIQRHNTNKALKNLRK